MFCNTSFQMMFIPPSVLVKVMMICHLWISLSTNLFVVFVPETVMVEVICRLLILLNLGGNLSNLPEHHQVMRRFIFIKVFEYIIVYRTYISLLNENDGWKNSPTPPPASPMTPPPVMCVSRVPVMSKILIWIVFIRSASTSEIFEQHAAPAGHAT